MTPADLLRQWIDRDAAPEVVAWFDAKRAGLAAEPSSKALAIAFSQARRLGKAELALTEDELAAAEAARPGWRPQGLTAEQAGRILLLSDAGAVMNDFPEVVKSIFSTSDLGERIALLRGLPLYPRGEELLATAIEGVRTAMQPIFEAVAHGNPYAAEHFPQPAWNQMVLKALFIDSTMAPIVGLDDRWNAELAATMIDYAHERWAAGRVISPELWRGVGRFVDAAGVADLAKVLATGDETSRKAAALALSESSLPEAAAVLAAEPALASAVANHEIGWKTVLATAPKV